MSTSNINPSERPANTIGALTETEDQTQLKVLRQALEDGENSGESARSHAKIIALAKAEWINTNKTKPL